MEEGTLILTLIKDHLVYSRLVNGLTTVGVEADAFYLHLSNTIFSLAALNDDSEQSQNRYTHYLNLVEQVNDLDAAHWREEAEHLALEIYAVVLQWQEESLREMVEEVEWL